MTIDSILQRANHAHGITALNAMQKDVLEAWSGHNEIILYSPTGSGKTLAFTAPLVLALSAGIVVGPQAVVITPSRELAQQVGETMRTLAQGFKTTCVYGGHRVEDERLSLNPAPVILVGTPGRILDHMNRGHIVLDRVRFLVIDEFDKCLELGFEEEMKKVVESMHFLEKRMFTSATQIDSWPSFISLKHPFVLNRLVEGNKELSQRMSVLMAACNEGDRPDVLSRLLLSLPATQRTVVFVNFRESVDPLCRFLNSHGISAEGYHGEMQQLDREKAVAQFNNGSIRVLVATDLAARGLDFENVTHIIHYHMPVSPDAFIHRNGRTARTDKSGEVIVMKCDNENLPQFIHPNGTFTIPDNPPLSRLDPDMLTLYFKAGKKEKISKADIVGFIVNNSHLEASQVGQIVVKDHYALVAIPRHEVQKTLHCLQSCRIKGKKVPISIAGNASKSKKQ